MAEVSLTQWAFLDPALMEKEIEAAKGTTFTTFSVLSPALMQAQIEANVGHSVFSNGKGITDPTWTPVSLAAAIG